MFQSRDMQTGLLVGSPIMGGAGFFWPGTALWCQTAPYHGALLVGPNDNDPALQKLYEIVVLAPTGSGTIVTLGAPTYESGLDRVTRTVTLSIDPGLPTPSQQGSSELDTSALRKTILDALYDADKRLRVLEAKPAITRAQFKTGLVNLYVANLG